MAENLVRRINAVKALSTVDRDQLQKLLVAVVDALEAQAQAIDALTAKMDADFADVTNASTDYAATIGTIETDLDGFIVKGTA